MMHKPPAEIPQEPGFELEQKFVDVCGMNLRDDLAIVEALTKEFPAFQPAFLMSIVLNYRQQHLLENIDIGIDNLIRIFTERNDEDDKWKGK